MCWIEWHLALVSLVLMPPMVLAIVLGDKAEEAFRQSLLSSQGSLGIFFANSLICLAALLLMLGAGPRATKAA